MSDIILSELQQKASKLIESWWKGGYTGKYSTDKTKVFVLAGIAGAGKTSVVKYIIRDLNLDNDEVLFCAYTGMASSVLTRKNTPASTIHRSIYNISKIRDKETGKTFYSYKLKTKEEMSEISLIVADEFSMIPENMVEELMSFGIPVMFVGDKEQLPSITKQNDLGNNIDFFLDEPHRQALESPIFWAANKVRKGEILEYGNYGGKVKIVPKLSISEEKLGYLIGKADQVITGYNKTSKYINDLYRAVYLDIYPEDNIFVPTVGEKIMCIKNDWGKEITLDNGGVINLVNGIIGYMEGVIENHPKAQVSTIDFRPEFADKHFEPTMMDLMPFINPEVDKKGENVFDVQPSLRYHRLDDAYLDIDYFDFARSITCHKAQGSSFGKILYIEEVLNRKYHKNMVYTAITRAEDSIIIAR